MAALGLSAPQSRISGRSIPRLTQAVLPALADAESARVTLNIMQFRALVQSVVQQRSGLYSARKQTLIRHGVRMKNAYPVSLALLPANVLGAAPMVANAQAVTLDFSDIVTSSTNVPLVLTGMTITGSYTIDLANANLLGSAPVSPPVPFDSETNMSD
jgi:hypothetical protein